MATLCGRSSYYRAEAARLFEDAFMEALREDADAVRQAAVVGLINIDGARALALFKERGMVDDGSSIVREAVIKLAGQAGKTEDLVWLARKVGQNGGGQLAYQAIFEILAKEQAAVVARWAQRLGPEGPTSQQVQVLWEIAEKKADSEKAVEVLLSARKALLEIYLQSNDARQVARVMAAHLSRQDIGDQDVLVVQIDKYLGSQEVEPAAKEALVGILEGIETAQETQERTRWAEQVKAWRAGL
jgi:hypothetical protein